MSSHDELLDAVGAELFDEMADVAASVLAQRPARSAVISELTTLVANHPEVVDASLDDTGCAHITFADTTTLHAQLDRAVVGMLVDPVLRFSVGGFWEENDGWIIGWQSHDVGVFIQTTIPTVHVTRHDTQQR